MSENILVCPNCQTDFETTSREQEMPRSHLEQQCPSCGHEASIGMVYYPDNSYVVVGPALESDTCDNRPRQTVCGETARYRIHRVGHELHTRCQRHTPGYLAQMVTV